MAPIIDGGPRKLYELSLSVVCSHLPPAELLRSIANSTVKCSILNKTSKRGNLNYVILKSLLNSKVSKLELSDCQISDRDLELLHLTPNLLKLNLNSLKGFRTEVTEKGLVSVANSCPNLKEFAVRRCSAIQDQGMLEIASKCKYLSILNLASCTSLTDSTLHAIAANLKLLHSMDISRNDNYSDAGVIRVAESLSETLHEVCITRCTKLTDDCIYALTTFCKKLDILSFAGCMLMTSQAHEMIDDFFSTKKCKLLSFTIEA